MVFPHIIVATGAADVPYGTVTISKAADSMLAMSKIEATFVIALNEQGSISISARSRSKVNVQKIMEQMGGGGHFNSAASQLENVTIDQVRAQLIDCIQEEVQKDKEEEE